MFLTVAGGSGSGKSAYAESRAKEFAPGDKIYIATMEPYDEESFRRIERHRRMRADAHYTTIECYRHLEEVAVGAEDTILLECMSNLAANEIFSPEGRGMESASAILEGVKKLSASCRNLIVVTNNVFEDGWTYDEGSENYLRILGEINQGMAAMADENYEVICGLPVRLGGRSKSPCDDDRRERMILITGGAFQGELGLAKKLAAEKKVGGEEVITADGKTASFEEICQADVLDGFTDLIANLIKAEEEPEPYIRELIRRAPELIVVTREVGAGLVPVDRFSRQWRESCGRCACLLAEASKEVYRVTAGLADRIK